MRYILCDKGICARSMYEQILNSKLKLQAVNEHELALALMLINADAG